MNLFTFLCVRSDEDYFRVCWLLFVRMHVLFVTRFIGECHYFDGFAFVQLYVEKYALSTRKCNIHVHSKSRPLEKKIVCVLYVLVNRFSFMVGRNIPVFLLVWNSAEPQRSSTARNCTVRIKCKLDKLCNHDWASTQETLSSGVCEQHRRRPACASTQSDHRLCYSLFGKYHMLT